MTDCREAGKPAPEASMVKPVQRESASLTYARWKSMMARCHNPNATNFKYYGGRGIAVCERWRNYQAFKEDMGECPGPKMTLDRIENDAGYQPGNCRWATKAEQSKNRRNCILYTYNGESKNITDWAACKGLPVSVLWTRINSGWSLERALNEPNKPGPGKQRLPSNRKTTHV